MPEDKIKYAQGKNPNSLANLKKARFKKGKSGNPAGRPKGIKYVSEALREQLVLGTEEKPSIRTKADKLAKNLIERARKSDTALSIILERTEGKVTQPIGGDSKMPLIIDKIIVHMAGENGSSDQK
jgi:hypothetical protein